MPQNKETQNPLQYWISEASTQEIDAMTAACYQTCPVRHALAIDNLNGWRADKDNFKNVERFKK